MISWITPGLARQCQIRGAYAIGVGKPMNVTEGTGVDGHFGCEEPEFTWERTDTAKVLRAAAGL